MSASQLYHLKTPLHVRGCRPCVVEGVAACLRARSPEAARGAARSLPSPARWLAHLAQFAERRDRMTEAIRFGALAAGAARFDVTWNEVEAFELGRRSPKP